MTELEKTVEEAPTTLETTVTEGMDTFFTKLTEATEVITEKLIEVTPQAAEALLNLIQFKGVFNITISGLFTGITLFLIINTVSLLQRMFEEKLSEAAIPRVIVQGFLSVLLILTCMVWALPTLLSFYNWLSALFPEGAIALKALEAVGIEL